MCVSDAVVSTSIQPPESFGRTVLESVKLGRPTVGYDHGGVGEVLEKIYPQGRVPLQDTDTMAEKLMADLPGTNSLRLSQRMNSICLSYSPKKSSCMRHS